MPDRHAPQPFETTVLRAGADAPCLLFAAGRGGNPLRHLGLLEDFAASGYTVIAPHCDMLLSLVPTRAELLERCRRLALAADTHSPPDTPLAGAGHSIGTVILLMLAGAQPSLLSGEQLTFTADRAPDRLVLLAPPTDFFGRPGSLASVKSPIQIWAGAKDDITPPPQARFLADSLKDQVPVDLRIVEEAGHFTFMNELPPHLTDSHPDRPAFLTALGKDVRRFLAE